MRQRQDQLNNLYGLRFFAAVYTIIFHYWSIPGNSFLNNFFVRGHISVPFFFILSGFVLALSYQEYEFSTGKRKYLLKRIIRLAPVYFLAMFLATPLIYLQLKVVGGMEVEKMIGFSLAHILLVQSFLPIEGLINFWNVHSWSISVEFFLYLSSLGIIPFLRGRKAGHILFIFLGIFIANTILYFTGALDSYPYFAPLYVPMFTLGVLSFHLFRYYGNYLDRVSSYLFLLSIVSLTILLFSHFEKAFFSSFNPLFQILFVSLIISCSFKNQYNAFLGSRLMVVLGGISYAMYILQAPTKLYVNQFLRKVLHYGHSSGMAYNLTILCSVIFVSWLITKFYDERLQKSIRRALF